MSPALLDLKKSEHNIQRRQCRTVDRETTEQQEEPNSVSPAAASRTGSEYQPHVEEQKHFACADNAPGWPVSKVPSGDPQTRGQIPTGPMTIRPMNAPRRRTSERKGRAMPGQAIRRPVDGTHRLCAASSRLSTRGGLRMSLESRDWTARPSLVVHPRASAPSLARPASRLSSPSTPSRIASFSILLRATRNSSSEVSPASLVHSPLSFLRTVTARSKQAVSRNGYGSVRIRRGGLGRPRQQPEGCVDEEHQCLEGFRSYLQQVQGYLHGHLQGYFEHPHWPIRHRRGRRCLHLGRRWRSRTLSALLLPCRCLLFLRRKGHRWRGRPSWPVLLGRWPDGWGIRPDLHCVPHLWRYHRHPPGRSHHVSSKRDLRSLTKASQRCHRLASWRIWGSGMMAEAADRGGSLREGYSLSGCSLHRSQFILTLVQVLAGRFLGLGIQRRVGDSFFRRPHEPSYRSECKRQMTDSILLSPNCTIHGCG